MLLLPEDGPWPQAACDPTPQDAPPRQVLGASSNSSAPLSPQSCRRLDCGWQKCAPLLATSSSASAGQAAVRRSGAISFRDPGGQPAARGGALPLWGQRRPWLAGRGWRSPLLPAGGGASTAFRSKLPSQCWGLWAAFGAGQPAGGSGAAAAAAAGQLLDWKGRGPTEEERRREGGWENRRDRSHRPP